LDLTETTTPPISSVYQSPYQMGAEAANLVLARLKDRLAPARNIVLKTELRVRDSVGPAPQSVDLSEQAAALRGALSATP